MKRIKGFSLFELLVVLAIIAFMAAVLLGLAIPNYVKLIVVTALVVVAISASLLIIITIFKVTLFKTCRKGDIEAVKQHLAAGTDVNEKVSGGRTPLHRAASLGHKEIAELLIAKGADVNAKEWDGRTPLNEAARWGHNEVADLLRKHDGKAIHVVDTMADDRTSTERRKTETIGKVGRIGVGVAIERLKEKAIKKAQKGLLP